MRKATLLALAGVAALASPALADPEPKSHDAARIFTGSLIGWTCREHTDWPVIACGVAGTFLFATKEIFFDKNPSIPDALQGGAATLAGAGAHRTVRTYRLVTCEWGGKNAGCRFGR